MLRVFRKYFRSHELSPGEKNPEEAYDLWAAHYDRQPGNLMLDLDEIIFSDIFREIDIENKIVADIGCGTGRHWIKILDKHPRSLTGFDISDGMLLRLREKFPSATVKKISDNGFLGEPESFYDVIISTLTVAHIENVREALFAWSRILKNGGEMIITDFHPRLLDLGGKRTFSINRQQFAVKNFSHSIEKITDLLCEAKFSILNKFEKRIDESVKHYYKMQNAMAIFNKFKEEPVIYGLHARKK
jgi:ubiquinone/menaquinone biosynthesis C-methylase UbiE